MLNIIIITVIVLITAHVRLAGAWHVSSQKSSKRRELFFFFSNFAVLPGELGKLSVVPDVSEVSACSRDAPQPIRRALEFPAVGELRV